MYYWTENKQPFTYICACLNIIASTLTNVKTIGDYYLDENHIVIDLLCCCNVLNGNPINSNHKYITLNMCHILYNIRDVL